MLCKHLLGLLLGASTLAMGIGVASPALAMMKMGYSGAGVSNLQSTLASLGFYDGPITGYFGELTQTAVINYQQSHGIAVDGVAGERTLRCLSIDTGTPVSSFSAASPPTVTTQTAAPSPSVSSPTQIIPQTTTTQVVQPQTVIPQTTMMLVPVTTGYVTQSVPAQSVVTTAPPVTTTGTTTTGFTTQSTTMVSGLRLGASGPGVTEVQQFLATAGYGIPVTGYFGEMTQSAVISFQQANGLVADGVVGPQTLSVLRSGGGSTTSFRTASATSVSSGGGSLRMGVSGQQVTQIQQALSRAGYSVPTTGYFGEMTHSAVKQFQAARGLMVDGVVGPATLAQLGI